MPTTAYRITMGLKFTALFALAVLSQACLAQDRHVKTGSGPITADIVENFKTGVSSGQGNGSCYALRSVDPGTGIIHTAGRLCGNFSATGYPNGTLSLQGVVGDDNFTTVLQTQALLVTVNADILPAVNDTYNIGSTGAYVKNGYFNGLGVGAPAVKQGVIAIANSVNANTFAMSGTNFAGGADLAVGSLVTTSSMYPVVTNNMDLGTAGQVWRKIYTKDISITGTCTGCASGANTFLSNLTSPTSINQDLLMSVDNTFSLGSGTAYVNNGFFTALGVGRPAVRQGTISIANTINANQFVLAGTNFAGGADLGVGSLFATSAMYPVNNNNMDLGATGQVYRRLYVNNITVGATAGITKTYNVMCNVTGVATPGTVTVTAGVTTATTCP